MSDRWTDRLSEYLDGELSAAEGRELESHLESCGACRSTVDDLRRVLARAGALEDRPPRTNLWPAIAERIGAGDSAVVELGRRRALRERRFSFSLPQMAAASVALVVLSAGAMWMAMSGQGVSDSTLGEPPQAVSTDAPPAAAGARGGSGVPVASFAERKYGAAISDLERMLMERREELNPETVRAIEANLVIIDRAIEQARRALVDDPASDYLNSYLAGAMRQKLELLRRAAIMTGASS